jgi:hypothetical protein
MPAMKLNSRLPAAPAPQMLRVENAMRMPPVALPHRPAPMYTPQQSMPMAVSSPRGFGAPSYSSPTFSAPRMSGPAAGGVAPASHPAASGKPH